MGWLDKRLLVAPMHETFYVGRKLLTVQLFDFVVIVQWLELLRHRSPQVVYMLFVIVVPHVRNALYFGEKLI